MDMDNLWLCFAVTGMFAAGIVASGKNRNVVGWSVFGFLLPLLAVILALVLAPLDSADTYERARR